MVVTQGAEHATSTRLFLVALRGSMFVSRRPIRIGRFALLGRRARGAETFKRQNRCILLTTGDCCATTMDDECFVLRC